MTRIPKPAPAVTAVPVSPADLRPGDTLWRDDREMTVVRVAALDFGWLVEWAGPGTASGVFSVLAGRHVHRVPTGRWVAAGSGPDYRCES